MIEVVGYRVLIEPDPVEEVSEGGIITFVTDSARSMEERAVFTGTVVQIGGTAWMGIDDGKPWVEVGDRVYFAIYAGKSIVDKQSGKKYIIVNDRDIHAKIVD